MNNPMMDALAAAAARNGGAVVPMPTQAQRDELARVQGMQVRTNAITLAVQYASAQGTDCEDLMVLAEDIEKYILGA